MFKSKLVVFKSLEEDLEGLGTVNSLEDATYQVQEYEWNWDYL